MIQAISRKESSYIIPEGNLLGGKENQKVMILLI